MPRRCRWRPLCYELAVDRFARQSVLRTATSVRRDRQSGTRVDRGGGIMRDLSHDSTDRASYEPARIFPCRPCPKDGKRSPSLQQNGRIHESTDSIAWHSSVRPIACVFVAIASYACLIAASTLFESSVRSQTISRAESIDRFAKFIAEASARFTYRRVGFVPSSRSKAVVTSTRSPLEARWA